MKAQWNLFHGQRTAEGHYIVTVRCGAFAAHGGCHPTFHEALACAEQKFESQFRSLDNGSTDLTALLD